MAPIVDMASMVDIESIVDMESIADMESIVDIESIPALQPMLDPPDWSIDDLEPMPPLEPMFDPSCPMLDPPEEPPEELLSTGVDLHFLFFILSKPFLKGRDCQIDLRRLCTLSNGGAIRSRNSLRKSI
jgi:hypothetical protein